MNKVKGIIESSGVAVFNYGSRHALRMNFSVRGPSAVAGYTPPGVAFVSYFDPVTQKNVTSSFPIGGVRETNISIVTGSHNGDLVMDQVKITVVDNFDHPLPATIESNKFNKLIRNLLGTVNAVDDGVSGVYGTAGYYVIQTSSTPLFEEYPEEPLSTIIKEFHESGRSAESELETRERKGSDEFLFIDPNFYKHNSNIDNVENKESDNFQVDKGGSAPSDPKEDRSFRNKNNKGSILIKEPEEIFGSDADIQRNLVSGIEQTKLRNGPSSSGEEGLSDASESDVESRSAGLLNGYARNAFLHPQVR
ncbi:hypothetical protein O4H49_04440 [Kiloniella laminariae]|uniref:Uncharacterized protein n=1 Tax=Kiloniella laminariae TaxID=454162 RepID=A0ABT4LFY3_9PROT|nr:hypothetical protein [Kiloniella laminariae]MCZ4280013.1 hypothetical protein [Kiloniella laminariae]